MSEITIAESAGFCFGVDRAVKMVYNELGKNTRVATLGPIIHNQDVVNDMLAKGARVIESVDELEPDETVVIRSHGVGRDVYEQIEAKGNRMIDATCPFVSRIHKIVAEMSEKGYLVFIAGDALHPEVQGIVGHCSQKPVVFKDNYELNDIFAKTGNIFKKPLAFVAQTTYNINIWQECLKMIPKDDPNIIVYDTICNATEKRQTDAAELARRSDIMLVVGGKHSSNTVKLSEVCSRYCKTYHIENSDELSALKLPDAGKIGITAGASTPAHIIKEVFLVMSEYENNTTNPEEEVFDEAAIDKSFKKIHTGEKVKGIVVSVGNAEITVDLGTKHTGYVKLEDLTDDPSKKPADLVSVGDEIDLIVIKVNDAEGTAALSRRKVEEQEGYEKIMKAKEEGTVIEGVVQHIVNKGVTLNVFGVRVFIPASHTGLPRGAELDSLLKQKVQFKIIEVTEGRKRAVGSIREVLNAQKEEAKAKFWDDAEVGKTYVGKVKSLTSFGAFVDLGGIDGMVHISELSWKRIKHPSEVVSVGDTLEVYIKDLDREANRISLGFKKAEDNPWEIFTSNYKVGDVVKATIVSTTSFGAFAQIIDGVDGLIHISQLADKKVENVKDVVSVGDEVDVKIIDIDPESKRISISMRALLENDSEEAEDNSDADEVVYSSEEKSEDEE
ncbi:MAG: bifunctional 4-hydroxy-3-methylbut-2-enyl diphosphate reductase/30S ribosomal protein S1 [Ruminococcus sp.]|nr:bifunctional 4-hydroxy-3-methylbut-2-enyl diphosphate reductase/30S ribosomal protein S1 [Ruminococcus sp.]